MRTPFFCTLALFTAFLSGCATTSTPSKNQAATAGSSVSYFQTPGDFRFFIEAMASAKKSVHMTMFHLTDNSCKDALIAAKHRGVEVRIIINPISDATSPYAQMKAELTAEGIDVREATKKFSITHEKAFVVDGEQAYILSLNLTDHSPTTRDFGVRVSDPAVVKEMQSVFEADWSNAETNGRKTPKLQVENLLWSPITSTTKLVDLIDSAHKSVEVMVENLSDKLVIGALSEATQRGVKVRLIAPGCDLNPNPHFNFPAMRKLRAAGVDTRYMPAPATATVPYIHAKMIRVDAARVYIGSINFSTNSMRRARELGIIVNDALVLQHVDAAFTQDWSHAVQVSDQNPECPEDPRP